MKRTGLGIGILVVFLLGGLLCANLVETLCNRVSQSLEKAQIFTQEGDHEAAANMVEKAYGAWKKYRFAIAAFVNHEPMDEIDGLFSQTRIFSKFKANTDFAAGCGRLSELIEALAQSHKLTWWNLF